MVAEACFLTLGYGCGAAIAWGAQQAAACEEAYLMAFGIGHIPSGLGWESPCCPKACAFHTPGK